MRYVLCALLLGPMALPAQEKIPVLFDCDIGSDVDDAFALALLLASPELDVRGVTTVSGNTMDRAWMVCRFCSHTGNRAIPVAGGAEPQPKQSINNQFQYRYHPGVIFNRTSKPGKESAVQLMHDKLKADPGKITICAVGPLTNVARLLTEHPECKPWIKRIVIMGGSVRAGYKPGTKPEVEWNIKLDPKAAQVVFSSGVPLTVAPLDATSMLQIEEPLRKKLFDAHSQLTLNLQAMYQMWDQPTPTLYDPVAISLCIGDQFCTMADVFIEVDDKGMTLEKEGKANARVAVGIDKDAFLKWYVGRVSKAMPASLPKEPGNPSKLIERGKFPNRVHAFEDFETEIEKRWWLAGKGDKKNIPPGSTRSCQAMLTQDFDDRQGDMNTMYQAVVFNPVPGPPMGKNPRLSFRYFLKGTSTLRVQIYSLSKGYHRYLSLTDLPQGKWESGTVDMTQLRRPDGTGGPLSEDERIDDIQFYVDPRAELWIDDIVLYDEALKAETRPFPKRIHFTGWFDSGKQGKEWPGTFDIVEKEAPEKGKAAKSPEPKPGNTFCLIDLGVRGLRKTEASLELFCRFRLSADSSIHFTAHERGKAWDPSTMLQMKKQEAWKDLVVPLQNVKGIGFDCVTFLTINSAILQIDDVLLYEPGDAPVKNP